MVCVNGKCKSLLLCLLQVLLAEVCCGYLRVCYYTNWSQFRPMPTPFTPEGIDPQLCTHVIFAFGDLEGTGIETTEFNDEEMYTRLIALKDSNPSLRVMLSVGGWLAGGAQFSALVASEDSMVEFVNNAIRYLRRFGFDGLDVDWEYPGDRQRGSEPADRIRFTRLLQLLRSGFEEEAEESGRERLLLTAAVVAEIELSRQYYQIPQIARSVDFINLMAYDFHGQWDLSNGARHHSALFPEAHDAVQGWIEDGFPAGKLVLGIAAFARTFTLASRPRGTGVGQPAVNVRRGSGNLSDTEGLLTYQEICDLLDSGGWERVWLTDQRAPAAFGNVTGGRWKWAGYEDQDSITEKATYVKEYRLAGMMVWAISNDDFNNHCGLGDWPILSKLREQLPDDNAPPSKTPASPSTFDTPATSSTSPSSPVTSSPSAPPPTTAKPTTSTARAPITIPYNTTRWLKPRSKPRATTPLEGGEGRKRKRVRVKERRRNTEKGGTRTGTAGPRVQGDEPVFPADSTTRTITTTTTTSAAASGGPATEPGYRQCSISDSFGPSLRCTSHHGRTGSRTKFFLYCFNGFFAIECTCLPGFFYNRCIQTCDAESNFLSCPFRY